MEVIFGLNKSVSGKESVLTVGTFDGIHQGHRALIKELLHQSKARNQVATLLTFDPHPKTVVQDSPHLIKLLTTLEEKLEILQDIGIDRVVIAKFTREFSELSYKSFVEDILLTRLKARCLIIGYDHSFGKNRVGNFRELENLSKLYGFDLMEVGPFKIDDQTVSSTLIRSCVENGDMDRASQLLGHYYAVSGIVIKGEGRGQRLSFPTANLLIENKNKLTPKEGVYVVECDVLGEKYRGMANLGYKPTFGGVTRTVEVHIFDFSENIYGEKISIQFLRRLRDEVKFNSEEQLIEQLNLDKKNSFKIQA
ncbi:MAG: bifunctional riboflavin kinase/FAD synthetase [Calditrichales bacterium]|nr:MAG: bifunctional riboflavin kinase/FAD synthetase [Calditrichales bacterium]